MEGIVIFFYIVGAILLAICFWRIAEKLGYSGLLGLAMLIPFLNFFLLLAVAFSESPVEKAVNQKNEWYELNVRAYEEQITHLEKSQKTLQRQLAKKA